MMDTTEDRTTTSLAVISTASASRYLQQLCKHWAHKFETEHTETRGRIQLPLGVAVLEANETALIVEVSCRGDDDLSKLQQVVQSHIERFAFREILNFDWRVVKTHTPDPSTAYIRLLLKKT